MTEPDVVPGPPRDPGTFPVADDAPGFDYRISRLERMHDEVIMRLDQLDRHARWVAPWLIEEIQPVKRLEDRVAGLVELNKRYHAQLVEQRELWGAELHRMGQQISWHNAGEGKVVGLSRTPPAAPPRRRWWQR